MNPEQQKNVAEQQSAIDKRTVNIHLVTNGYIVGFPGCASCEAIAKAEGRDD